jgi:protein TonB
MNRPDFFNSPRTRFIAFAAVALLHILLLRFVAFQMEIAARNEEPAAGVMKLVDVEEELPPPPPDMPRSNTSESVAETMLESDVEPPPYTAYAPAAAIVIPEQIEYLPQHRISVLPVLPEEEIRRATVYPPIARRSNIEGVVYLELFIDRQGIVRDVRILRETPQDRGFGEAAVNAFRGIRGKPAEANGEAVAVRYRYNISFRLN